MLIQDFFNSVLSFTCRKELGAEPAIQRRTKRLNRPKSLPGPSPAKGRLRGSLGELGEGLEELLMGELWEVLDLTPIP